MKYIKKYNNRDLQSQPDTTKDEPQIGNYVKINSDKFDKDFTWIPFFNQEIGKIDSINQTELKIGGFPYYIIFENPIPHSRFRETQPPFSTMAFKRNELLAWAPTKKELKIKIDAIKYNL